MKLRVSIVEDGGEFSGDFTLERIITCVRFCMGVPSDRLKPASLLNSFRPLADGSVTDVLTMSQELEQVKAENARLRETIKSAYLANEPDGEEIIVDAYNLIEKEAKAENERLRQAYESTPQEGKTTL